MSPPIVVALVAAAVLPAAFTLDPTPDADLWWHLRVGQIVSDTGAVPRTDPFSRFARESDPPPAWLAYSWLFEWVIFQVYAAAGLAGMLAFRAVLGAISTAVVLSFAVRRVGATPAGLVAAGLAAVSLMPMMKERPWHVTIAFTTLTLAAVVRIREGDPVRRAWWLPAVFAAWANLHIQFVLGGFVLGLAAVFPGTARRRDVVALGAACGLATFANPYHVRLLGVIWEYATQTGPLRTVEELAPPAADSPWLWAVLALLGWAAVTRVRGKFDGFSLVLLAAGLFFTLRMRRDGWFGAVAALAVLGGPGRAAVPRWAVAAVVGGVFAVVRAANLGGFGPPPDPDAAARTRYPVAAAAWVRDHRPPGPLFNVYDWGGYLIWAVPEYPVSIDGRTNLYGSDRVVRAMRTAAAAPGWDADPDLTSASVAVVPANGPLAEQLRALPTRWREAFRDDTASVFVRPGESH